jgi:hypothetical protein
VKLTFKIISSTAMGNLSSRRLVRRAGAPVQPGVGEPMTDHRRLPLAALFLALALGGAPPSFSRTLSRTSSSDASTISSAR